MLIKKDNSPATYLKSKQGGMMNSPRKNNFKAVAMLLGLLVFIGGAFSVFLISQSQDTTPVAPTAPQSQPAAFISKTNTCTLQFEIEEIEDLACGDTGCEQSDLDCADGLICMTADNGVEYCAKEEYEDACAADPTVENCCSAPPEEEVLVCGDVGCGESDKVCADGLICMTASDGVEYCALEEFEDACSADPSVDTCCSEPGEEILVCGDTGCGQSDLDCAEGLICMTADDGVEYCAKEQYEDACAADPSVANCCSAQPTITVTEPPEEETLSCGEAGCENTDDCEEGFICVSTSETDDDGDIVKYCADEDYLDACVANPSDDSCCEAGTTVTPTDEPTVTPSTTTTVTTTVTGTSTPTTTGTITPTASVTTVITTVNCNDTCEVNADCSNISHICYQNRCRLDVNPTDASCRLANGETTIVRPVYVPTESGPADWLNYLKAGLGILGIGALLLLLL